MGDHHQHGGVDLLGLLGPSVAALAVLGYLVLVLRDRGRPWPRHRVVAWLVGCLTTVIAVSGPLAAAARTGFVAHMATHVLLGMLAPLLLVLAAPVTLILRALPVTAARRLSRILTSRPARVFTEPTVAAVLAVGGMWLLYGTGLYAAMPHTPWLHVIVHAHFLIAGYLFATAMVAVDPLPHRRSFVHRSVVLVLALAAHDILAKYLYAQPPPGIELAAAETGAMVMYYGGDAVDLAIIVLLWARWYRSTSGARSRAGRWLRPAARTLVPPAS